MAYQKVNALVLGPAKTGLTITAVMYTASGMVAEGFSTTLITEVAAGVYLADHLYPDAVPGVVVYDIGGGEYTAVDVNTSDPDNLTAAEVWSYSTRTLSDYGTLIADIWAAGTRTLTSYGTLVVDIWANSTRTLSSYGTLVADIWASGTRTLTSYGTLVADIWANSTRTLSSYGTLVADTATAVWAAGTRTLTSLGSVVADTATAVWAAATRTLTAFTGLPELVEALLTASHGAGSWVDSGGAGTGANSVTLTILDDVGNPVVGASVSVKNAAETATVAGPQASDGNGRVVFNIDSGTYHAIVRSGVGYQTLAAQTLVVTGTTTASYTLTRVSTSTPTAADACLVYGFMTKITGDPAVGVSLTFSLPSTKGAEAWTSEFVQVASTETVTTDSGGRFEVQLIWSSAIHQYLATDVTTYAVSCAAAKLTAHFVVPDQATLDLTSILPPVD